MNVRLRCLVLGISLACLAVGRSGAQVVMTVDWSNLSAVKFTATSNFSAINYPGGTSFKFNDGIALIGFLTAPANVQDLDNGAATATSTLTDSANTPTANSTFNRLASWNDTSPGFYPNGGNGSDLTLWNDPGATVLNFSTSSAAFNGEAVFDLSAYATYTNLFPALNATGNVRIWNNNGTLGTWQVVGVAAIPEPSTYAVLAGVAALGFAAFRRRRSA